MRPVGSRYHPGLPMRNPEERIRNKGVWVGWGALMILHTIVRVGEGGGG